MLMNFEDLPVAAFELSQPSNEWLRWVGIMLQRTLPTQIDTTTEGTLAFFPKRVPLVPVTGISLWKETWAECLN